MTEIRAGTKFMWVEDGETFEVVDLKAYVNGLSACSVVCYYRKEDGVVYHCDLRVFAVALKTRDLQIVRKN